MAVITIPFDYNEITHPQIIPICIADTDAKGNLVYPGWIEHGVVPVAHRLLRIAERVLLDKFRASEITEYAVHSLSRKYGENIGDRPAVRVLNRARLHAEDLRVGGRRARRKFDVELFVETLESLEDHYDLVAALEAKEMVDIMVAQLDVLGLDRVKELVPYMLRNAEGHELASEFGQKRNTITTRFYRGMRKAAKAAGISWY
jgi:predicted ABC-class ATPase